MSAGFRFSRDGVLDYKEFNSLLRVVFPDSSLSTVPEEKLRAFMTSLDCNKVEYKITDQIKRQRHSNGSATQTAAPLKRQRHSKGSATQTAAPLKRQRHSNDSLFKLQFNRSFKFLVPQIEKG